MATGTRKKFGASNKNDVAITSLALLAFVGYGHSEKVGEHKDVVKRAVHWLMSKQRPDGMIIDTSDDSASHRSGGYPMAMATLAIAECAAMANVPDTRAAAQKAVDYCTSIHQFGEGYDKLGWRYSPKSEGDLSVSGWFIMALKSARIAGLKVDHAAFDGAIKFLDSVEIKDKGGDSAYGPISRYKYMVNNEHAGTAHRLTAIGTLARQFMGWKKEDLQAVSTVHQQRRLPRIRRQWRKSRPLLLVLRHDGRLPAGRTAVQQWSDSMLKAMLPSQRKQGDDNGSWDPVGEYSGEWGRVGQTALSALILEVYYRYPLVNKGNKALNGLNIL